ncbi:protein kinase [Achlya hypogyna]|uniref:Protein kinase n=1 Tax=Achlya hypogyna TaxID=1202772 RepID=A0A1V9YI30_ACHHY|nr:protein kinase [Achlya hypogyna]
MASVACNQAMEPQMPTPPPASPGNGNQERRVSLKRPLQADAEVMPADLELLKVIGRGTFAQQVALAKDRHTSLVYAVKSCDKQNLVRRKQVVHTWTEKKILEQLRGHPFVVTLFSTFATSDEVHFVLEYCPGGELFYHLHQQDHFNESIVRFYAAEVLCALKSLHSSNIVYRDLKPENVLLDAQGHVRLADFGFCKDLSDTERTYSFCGSPEYLSPEMIARRGHSLATDMWSFGCFCYELAVGHPPFQLHNDSLPELFDNIRAGRVYYPPELSPSFVTFLKGCLETDTTVRLTALRAMNEPFFEGVDWKAVWARQNPPPFQPSVSSSECTQNFDDDFTSESPRSPTWDTASHNKRPSAGPADADVFSDF